MIATTIDSTSVVMKYYNKYAFLANSYARQVDDSYRIGMDYDDLVQEFRLKIYTSIIAYAKKWQEYKTTGRYRPVPMDLYIKSALNNKKKDLFREIGNQPFQQSIEDTGFDYSVCNTMHCRIKPDECIAELNGIDLLVGMSKPEARCFIMYLYGFPIKKLQRVFAAQIKDVQYLVDNRINQLRDHYSALSENLVTVYKTYSLEEQ